MQIGGHFVWPDAIAILSGFFDRIGAKANNFTFDQDVKTIAVRQRLADLNVEVIFRHFQYFTDRQADKLWRIKGADVPFTRIHKVVGAATMKGFIR